MGYREHVGGYRGRKTGHDILKTVVIVLNRAGSRGVKVSAFLCLGPDYGTRMCVRIVLTGINR